MTQQAIPSVNYSFAPIDGHNVFREKFGELSDDDWCEILVRSIKEPVIDGVSFANFPEDELQNRIHGNSGVTSITEAAKFFKFVKHHTYKNSSNAVGKRLLNLGLGWGRVIRPFMRTLNLKISTVSSRISCTAVLARTLKSICDVSLRIISSLRETSQSDSLTCMMVG